MAARDPQFGVGKTPPGGDGLLACEAALDRIERAFCEMERRSTGNRHARASFVRLREWAYAGLGGWQTVQLARHPARPSALDYVGAIAEDFCELHGDRCFGDDAAIVTGFGRIGGYRVLLVGHNKGRTADDRVRCRFGYAHPEGYRKALAKMKLAEKFGLPIVTLIDTPGAYPGMGAEERGIAHAIAVNLMEMSRLRVPIICVVLGEGGSGGALGIGVGDRVAMLQYAYYSVITPEGCAAILWRDRKMAPRAAEALGLTAPTLEAMGLIDDIIAEPEGGAHRDPARAARFLEDYLVEALRDLTSRRTEVLLEQRQRRLRDLGTRFVDREP